jgi:hypothetical protein
MAETNHLPFEIVSDSDVRLWDALRLPTLRSPEFGCSKD